MLKTIGNIFFCFSLDEVVGWWVITSGNKASLIAATKQSIYTSFQLMQIERVWWTLNFFVTQTAWLWSSGPHFSRRYGLAKQRKRLWIWEIVGRLTSWWVKCQRGLMNFEVLLQFENRTYDILLTMNENYEEKL